MSWATVWITLLVVGLIAEAISLAVNPRRGTLSAQVKWLRSRFVGDAAITAFFAWLIFHWWMDDGLAVVWDFVALGIGLTIATVTHLHRKAAQ